LANRSKQSFGTGDPELIPDLLGADKIAEKMTPSLLGSRLPSFQHPASLARSLFSKPDLLSGVRVVVEDDALNSANVAPEMSAKNGGALQRASLGACF